MRYTHGMAFTAFVSQSAPGNAAHNERDFKGKHKEPDYLLPAEHRRPNIHIKTEVKANQVYRDYVRTSAYGRKSGRLHHSAKPIREAVILCKMDTTEDQVRALMTKLEKGLGIRALYAHVHKDEGHIDEKTGKVKYNPHIHFGYTNLVIERDEQGRRQGELTDMNRPKMRKAQDICAEALGMERAPHYTEKTRKKNLSHQAFRAVKETENRVQAALDAAEEKPQTAEEKTGGVEQQVINLVTKNKQLRKRLTESGIATKENYKELAEIKRSELPLREKVIKMAEYVDSALAKGEPAPSPVTPRPKKVGGKLYKLTGGLMGPRPRRVRLKPNPPVATPPPVQVQAPPPLPPLFVDTMRAWMKQEEAKRKAAEEEATKAKGDLKAVKLERDEAQKQWGLWEKSTAQALGLVKTLSRFILALDKGLKLAWDRNTVATFTQELKPGEWFKATLIDGFNKTFNGKVDHFNEKPAQPKPPPAPTKARDDYERD